jgi:hypothetical protein
MTKVLIALIFSQFLFISIARSQDNYEIQVYGSETVPKHNTMVELHSNFTVQGSKTMINGVLPTHHVFHETIEITHGFTDWFETGFYLFNTIGNQGRTSYVGSHIRPRVALPYKYHFPVGLSLSAEVGYQKREYSEDDWTVEIRPIIDKTIKKFYFAFNPVLDKSLHGLNSKQSFVFSPNAKISYSVTKQIIPGLEYYGSVGPVTKFSAFQYQQQQLFLVLDLNYSEDWEFNAGYGIGFTNSTDRSIFKVIVGRRIHK